VDRVDQLLDAYRRQLALPWRTGLSGAERVWMAVYPPELERRIRARTDDFRAATTGAGHPWFELDLTQSFPRWMADHKYRDAYFSDPGLITPSLGQFARTVESQITDALTSPAATPDSVVALIGAGTLFPMVRISNLLQHVSTSIQGRLLVLFPGSFEDGNYRLLDARDGWNYLAIPITITEGTAR
jgi:hypothetical protein